MFEKTAQLQKEVVSQLISDINNDQISLSMLFYGPEFSSRLTACVEFSKAVCKGDYDYSILNTPYLKILTKRNSRLLIDSAFNLWLKYSNTFFRKNVIFEIKLFLMQFDDNITSLSSKELKDLKLNQISEILYEITKERDYTKQEVNDYISTLKGLLNPALNRTERSLGISIDQIRLINNWLKLSDEKNKKVVVLENIEDISIGAKNSLLKLLEEPPENSYIILISSSVNRLLDTLLSRVRKYEFKEPSKQAVKELLSTKYYSDSSDFYSFHLENVYNESFDEIKDFVSLFVDAIINKNRIGIEKINSLLSLLDQYDTFDYFYHLVIENLEDALRCEIINDYDALTVIRKFNTIVQDGKRFNQNQHNTFDLLLREFR